MVILAAVLFFLKRSTGPVTSHLYHQDCDCGAF